MPTTRTTHEQQDEALALRAHGRSFQQIADHFGWPLSTARRSTWLAAERQGRDEFLPPARLNRAGRRASTRRNVVANAVAHAVASTGRRFGAEIEFVGFSYHTARTVLRDAGLDVEMNGRDYDHTVMPRWKAVYDGSVRGGAEAVSPPMTRDDGFAQLTTAMAAIRSNGGRVTGSCGFHVHVSMDGLSGHQVANVVETWMTVQPIVDSFIAHSRRAGRHQYAGARLRPERVERVATALRAGAQAPTTWSALETSARQHYLADYGAGRYVTLNLDAFRKYGTVEFRQHGGTLNARKAKAWIDMLLAFVEAAAAEAVVTTSVEGFLNSLVPFGLDADNASWLLRRATTLTPPYGTALNEPTPEPVIEPAPFVPNTGDHFADQCADANAFADAWRASITTNTTNVATATV